MANILIVEDNIMIARDLEAILIQQNHNIVGIAKDSSSAETLVEDENVDLAFLDIQIEGEKDGVSLAYFLRDIRPELKIVFVTSHTNEKTVKRAAVVKPNGFVVKPFSEEAIFAALTVALADDRLAPQQENAACALNDASDNTSKLSYEQVSRLESYVLKHFDREITLKEMADVIDVSESHFSRMFKATYGISPYQYVVSERIAEAKRLLRNTHTPMSDIASLSGFSSQSHFTTAFKKVVGITPLTYRKL